MVKDEYTLVLVKPDGVKTRHIQHVQAGDDRPERVHLLVAKARRAIQTRQNPIRHAILPSADQHEMQVMAQAAQSRHQRVSGTGSRKITTQANSQVP